MNFFLLLLLILPQGLLAQGRDGAVEVGRGHYLESLRQSLHELKQKIYEEELRFFQLKRLKIRWDLLLPIREKSISGDLPLPSRSMAELRTELNAEIQREVALKNRYRRMGGIDTDLPLPGIRGTSALPDPVPSPVAKAPPRASVKPKPPEPKKGTEDPELSRFGPLRTRHAPFAFGLPRSEALTPFGASKDVTLFAPSRFVSKRVRTLIDAGMAKEALSVLEAHLKVLKEKKLDPKPSLLFLKAQTLEGLGQTDQAKVLYAQVEDLDRGADLHGKEKLGAWARSARFALKYLRWLEANRDYTPPSIKDLK